MDDHPALPRSAPAIDDDRHRTIVNQFHLHHFAKAPRLDSLNKLPTPLDKIVVQRFCYLGWGGVAP
jgi:hypothetical protein